MNSCLTLDQVLYEVLSVFCLLYSSQPPYGTVVVSSAADQETKTDRLDNFPKSQSRQQMSWDFTPVCLVLGLVLLALSLHSLLIFLPLFI